MNINIEKINELENLGWNSSFEESFRPYAEKGYSVGRVFAEFTRMYKIQTEIGEVLGEISGKMLHEAAAQDDFPAVGDWVVLNIRPEERKATIHAVLPRKSKFSRKAAGPNLKEQILASNIDTVFLVNALNYDFNVRRIERYLILAWESGANPVIVLSKADLCEDLDEKLSELAITAAGVPIHIISAVDGSGMEELKEYLGKSSTVALLGSSGVGKSTLINYLMGHEVMKTQGLRNGIDKGQHTSTHREIFILPEGGLIIDTPGMRELQLWDGDSGLSVSFEDIEALAKGCAFSDCKHEKEPNCAVREAVENGLVDRGRFENYKKLQKELVFLEQKQARLNKLNEKKSKKVTSKGSKNKGRGYQDMYE